MCGRVKDQIVWTKKVNGLSSLIWPEPISLDQVYDFRKMLGAFEIEERIIVKISLEGPISTFHWYEMDRKHVFFCVFFPSFYLTFLSFSSLQYKSLFWEFSWSVFLSPTIFTVVRRLTQYSSSSFNLIPDLLIDITEMVDFFLKKKKEFCVLNSDLGSYKMDLLFLSYKLWKMGLKERIQVGDVCIITLFLGMDGEKGVLNLLIVYV